MSELKLLIIGAGQIGSRHLQSLAKLQRSSDIYVIDPSINALQLAKERYNEVINTVLTPNNHTTCFSTDYENIPAEIDVAIIATTSNHRLEAIKILLKKTHPENIILEKIVFQDPRDFIVAQNMFETAKSSVWVNCPRRFWRGYQQVREEFKTSSAQQNLMLITGSKWGLCCNSIHFLDLYSFITGNSDLKLYSDQLDKKILSAQRNGFIELSGILHGNDSLGGQFLIKDYERGNIPLIAYFENKDIRCYVDETQGMVNLSKSINNWHWEKIPLQPLLQSELTHLYVDQILETETCTLPTFKDSWKIHTPLLEAFITHINKVTNTEHSACPIT